jgi:putative ABC transport system ATP-binding protein
MILSLEKFYPLPLKGSRLNSGYFWGSEEIRFESPGKFLVTGSSGRGKTSLLSMLYGIRKDYDGRIFIDGTDIRQLRPEDWSGIRKRKISCIFQGLELFDDLTAIENIRLKNGILSLKTEDEILSMAAFLEIDDHLDRMTGKLSFGQKQRVAIIRSLCQPFEFLLADEIFSHLDKKLEKLAFELVICECEKNRAGLLLTSLYPLEEFVFTKSYQV